MFLPLLTLSTVASAPALPVGGDARCPAPAEVERRLRALGTRARAPDDSVWLQEREDGVALELRSAPGGVVARRVLPRGDCAELVETAAVVVETWMAALDRASLPEPAFVGPSPAPLLASEAPPLPVELGAAVGGVVTSSGLTWGATLLAGLGRARGLGGRLELGAQGFTDEALGPGVARWQRFSLAAGPRYRWSGASAFLELYGELTGAVLFVRGSGYASDASGWGADAGASTGVRLGVAVGRASLWLDVGAVGWIDRGEAQVTGIPGTVVLPRFEADARLGVSWTAL